MDHSVIGKRDHILAETESCSAVRSTTHIVRGESSKKATNKDLPPGAQPAFRREVIPMIWHWAAGHAQDPFNINEDDLVEALVIIWRHVYANCIPFHIHLIVSQVRRFFSALVLDLLMTYLRLINGLLSGTTILHQQQPLQWHLSFQATSITFNITAVWHSR